MPTALATPLATSRQTPVQPPVLERARGEAHLAVAAVDGNTLIQKNYQAGAARLRFPARAATAPLEAVFINTAGGLTGGDSLRISVDAGPGSNAVVTTPAAERIYRRATGAARIETNITVESMASLDWLPQETIVFDRSALTRTLTAEVHPDARFLAVEATVLGRAAMQESAKNVVVSDSWRIRRGGRLVFADGLKLAGDATDIMAGGATGNGAKAAATLVLVATDAAEKRDVARRAAGACTCDCGVSARGGVLVARLVATSCQALRANLIPMIESLRGAPMPRVWSC